MSAEATGGTTALDERGTWTGSIRGKVLDAYPPDRVLPDKQPAYVASWIYVFGALTMGAFVVVILSGAVIAIVGPAWWHVSNVGLFFNSVHLWGTEFFFMFMVVHLWGKFFMAAWRGKRKLTWITGVVTFIASIGTAFTGYLSQQNLDSEWIGTQAKDGINSIGVGAYFNVLNFGQMLMWHIVLLPIVVAALIGIHVLLVRRIGVVPPFAPTPEQLAKAGISTAAGGAGISAGGAAPVASEPADAPPSADTEEPGSPKASAGATGDTTEEPS